MSVLGGLFQVGVRGLFSPWLLVVGGVLGSFDCWGLTPSSFLWFVQLRRYLSRRLNPQL